jgi:glycosyltransferase involved in cell wall biosynthesis
MRVVQIIPSISLVYGGPSQMVLGLSAALAAAGVDVTILTTNSNGDNGQPPLNVPLNIPVEQDGYQIRYFSCSPFRRYKFSLPLLQWLAKHAAEFDIAHIHALFSPVSTAAAWVARSQNLPYILRPLGTLDPADLKKKKLLKKLYGWLLERPNLAGAAGIHFTSTLEAQVSERFGVVTKDLIIPLGVKFLKTDISPVSAAQSSVPQILFMSRIDPKKGLNLLLPALEKLVAEGLNFNFILAGSNPQDPGYEAQISQWIKSSNLSDRTTITGFVSGKEKAELLQNADLFVLPSYYENFGIAVAEAMAAGIPVVISQGVYIWEEVEKAAAGWVTNLEINALSETLRLALQDAGERQRRGKNGQQYAQTSYSWQAIAQQTIQVYRRIIIP